MRDYNIQTDLKQEKFQSLSHIKLVQGDTGNKIKVNVFEDGKVVDLNNCSISAKYKRADGKEVINGTIENITGNSFDVVVNSAMTKTIGTLKMLFTITKDDLQVSTFIIDAYVSDGIIGGVIDNVEIENTNIVVDLSNYYSKNEIDVLLANGNILYISPKSLDEFVELTKEGGIFYSLTSFPVVYNNNTYNVVGLIDSRPHSNGFSYYAFHKMWQFLINPDTKVVTSFSSFSEFLQNKIPSDASKLSIKDTNNNFTSDNVEGALKELAERISNITGTTITTTTGIHEISSEIGEI